MITYEDMIIKVAYNKNEKELRPFIGILFKIDTYEYFAPLVSTKHEKMKNTIDFFNKEWRIRGCSCKRE